MLHPDAGGDTASFVAAAAQYEQTRRQQQEISSFEDLIGLAGGAGIAAILMHTNVMNVLLLVGCALLLFDDDSAQSRPMLACATCGPSVLKVQQMQPVQQLQQIVESNAARGSSTAPPPSGPAPSPSIRFDAAMRSLRNALPF